MTHDFLQIRWDDALVADCRALVDLAIAEDGGVDGDITTRALGLPGSNVSVHVAAREAGVAAGIGVLEIVFEQIGTSGVQVVATVDDGDTLTAGTQLATIKGDAGAILLAERTVLNLLGRLCGVATQAARYAAAVECENAAVYDTRKTTPGWRRLEKYAVACGGCRNHRGSLADAFLIKDNHLALWAGQSGLKLSRAPAAAIEQARRFAGEHPELSGLPVEIEVDTLAQLENVLPAGPDIVLLDNMTIEQLRQAAEVRDRLAPDVTLEASGGIALENIGRIATTGVDRISVGSLTHAARSLDIGLDWG